MGCTGSRHALRGGGGRSPYARSCSGPVSHHIVALKSSTLGSLSLDRDEEMMKWRDDAGVGAAKTPPSKQQQVRRQRQVQGSPAKTPVGEPEVINVWELMDGLDDKDEDADADADGEERRAKSAPGSPVFDPDIVAAFRKALDEVSPLPDVLISDDEGVEGPGGNEEAGVKRREIQKFPGIVRARVSAFQQRIDAKLAKMGAPPAQQQPSPPPPPDSARKVVLYLTSLRGIRKTYEDCWSTRSVLQGYGVRVDERDLSMHSGFKDELHAALGAAAGRLPQVFADGKHLGGAEEVRRMHEAGELSGALEACEMAPPSGPGKGVPVEACSGCGGVRFVPCDECSGSCKVFLEEVGSFRRCPECNENGLVRCPLCSL